MENENASPEPLDYIRVSKYNHGIIMGYTAPVNRKGIFPMHNSKRDSVRFFIQFALLAAIEAVFCFTPLGSLPAIGPIVATLAMIPVIITSILLGTKAGTLMGAITGLTHSRITGNGGTIEFFIRLRLDGEEGQLSPEALESAIEQSVSEGLKLEKFKKA